LQPAISDLYLYLSDLPLCVLEDTLDDDSEIHTLSTRFESTYEETVKQLEALVEAAYQGAELDTGILKESL
jgi:hypothetical protein